MNVLENAKKHYREQLSGAARCIEVPEWGQGDEPAHIYVRPETLEQRDSYYSLIVENKLKGFAMCIITRARNEAGKRMFSKASLQTMLTEFDPDVVIRVAGEILDRDAAQTDAEGADEKDAQESPAKNS